MFTFTKLVRKCKLKSPQDMILFLPASVTRIKFINVEYYWVVGRGLLSYTSGRNGKMSSDFGGHFDSIYENYLYQEQLETI